MYRNVFLLTLCLAVVPGYLCSQDIDTNKLDESTESTSRGYKYNSDLKFLYNTYQECSNTELSNCLKLKLFEVVDRVARARSDITLVDGISFVKDSDKDDENTLSVEEIKNQLPRSIDEKERALNDLLFGKLMSFLKAHTLQVKLPVFDDSEQGNEARGSGGYGGGGGNKGGFGGGKNKDKKNGHWIMIPLLLGSTLVPLAFGALALLAGKALIVSKLALALASIIGIKKLISGSGSHHEAAHEVVVSGGHGSGWGRIGNFGGQSLAYNAYNP